MSELLSIDNLYVNYGDSPILRGVSIKANSGEIIGIVGESGSGKSTSIYSTLGILSKEGKITSGDIFYNGNSLLNLSKERLRSLRGSEISLIAQNPIQSFHPVKKIRSQLFELAKSHGIRDTQALEDQMIKIMEKINLKDGKRILGSYAFELSGGMCQRVSIAMAMVMNPKLLFGDEPTSALDVTVQKSVVDELLRLRDEYGTTMVIVSHNMGVISYMADRIYVMYAGVIVESGSNDQVMCRPVHPYTKRLIQAVPSMKKMYL